MSDIIERLESATGEDLALLREAGAAAFGWDGDTDNIPEGLWRYEEWLNKGAFMEAAMSLVPEGWLRSTSNENGYEEVTLNNHEMKRTAWAHAPTAALALCIAALKARESSVVLTGDGRLVRCE